ncbi:MAG: 5'/3'-nucleotidase SurE [Thermofilum sp. ex4484_79]|nr:MAG: 5'/3'-nucleotidase SurE [Thermofilum sp. ex4484_79]
MKNILITNDDGLSSIGLKYLIKSVSKIVDPDKMYVIAPVQQRSGISKAISFKVKTKIISKEKPVIIGIDGTPADSVLLAVNGMVENIGFVLSGFNLGPNLGIEDVLTSGTVGAAFEAALHNIPSVSLSIVAEKWDDYNNLTLKDLEEIDEWTTEIISYILKSGLPENVDLLNINFPLGRIKGIRITKIGNHYYRNFYEHEKDTFRVKKWSLAYYECDDRLSDIHAIKNHYVSITPLRISNLVDNEDILSTSKEFFKDLVVENL